MTINFTQFDYKTFAEECEFDANNIKSVFGFIFREEVFDEHALTFSCLEEVSSSSGSTELTARSKVSWAIKTQLKTLALLLNIAKWKLFNDKTRTIEADAIRNGPSPNDLLDDDDEDEDENIEMESEDDIMRKYSVNNRINEIFRFNHNLSDDDENASASDKRSYVMDFLQRDSEVTKRRYDMMSSGVEEEDDEETEIDDEDGETDIFEDDHMKQYVHVLRKNGFCIFIVIFTNPLLTYDNINYIFEQILKNGGNNRKRGGKNKNGINIPDIEKFTSGLTLMDMTNSYQMLMRDNGVKSESDVIVKKITDMFKITNIYETLILNNGVKHAMEMFFSDEMMADRSVSIITLCKSFRTKLMRNNHVEYVRLRDTLERVEGRVVRKEVYSIPITQFTFIGVERGLLPWLDQEIALFFTNVKNNPASMYSSSYLSNVNPDFFPKDALNMKSDPMEYLKKFIKDYKTKKGGKLTMGEKRYMCKLFGYVFENPKLATLYSQYNRALIERIREIRMLYSKFYIRGKVSQISENSRNPKLRMKGNFGPLTCLLVNAADILRVYNTVPNEYLSLVSIVPLIMGGNSHNRDAGTRFHIMIVGAPQGGKNYLLSIIKKLIPTNMAYEIQNFSRRAFNTKQPQNGGVIIQNEAPPIMTEPESKMSFTQREMLDQAKEMFSSNMVIRQAVDWVPSSNNGPSTRNVVQVATPVSLCFLWSTNNLNNDENSAIRSRFQRRTVFKYKNSALLGNYIRKKSLNMSNEATFSLVERYHDIIMLQSVVTMMVSVGIVEAPTTGVASEIINLVLDELKTSGVTNTDCLRGFGRIDTALRQLTYASAMIKEYMMGYEVKEFKYEDVVNIIEPKLHVTTEVMVQALGVNGEQYLDPIRSIFVSTLIKKFTRFDQNMLNLSVDEVKDANSFIKNSQARTVKRRKVNINKTGGALQVGTKISGMMKSGGGGSVKKRRKRVRLGNVLGGVKRKRKNDGGSVDMTNASKSRLVNVRERRDFEIAIRNLDKLLLQMIITNHKFVEHNNQNPTVNLNCIQFKTTINYNFILDHMYYSMNVEPAKSDVKSKMKTLRTPKHIIPIWFALVDRRVYMQQIEPLYNQANPTPIVTRLDRLRTIIGHRYIRNVTKPLLKITKPDQKLNIRHTTITVSPFIFGMVDPNVLFKVLFSKLENASTIEKIVYCPKVIINPIIEGTQNDFELVKIKPNKSIREFRFNNPGYINKKSMQSSYIDNLEYSERIESIKSSSRREGRGRRKKRNDKDVLDLFSKNSEFDEQFKVCKNKTISISTDFDEFMGNLRVKELKMRIKKRRKKKKKAYNNDSDDDELQI